jgi:hypothetical protein
MKEELTLHEDGAVYIPSQYDQIVQDGGLPVTFQLKRLEDRTPGEAWILLYYGESGSGKTFFCGTAGPRTLYINIGHGIETLLAPAFTMRYPDAKKMMVIDLTEKFDASGALIAAEAFDLITDVIDWGFAKIPNDWDTCVIDDATFMRQAAMNKALIKNASIRVDPTKRTVSLDQFTVPEIQDYGREMQMIEWFLRTYVPKFKALKKNLIMTAHERKIYGKPPKIGEPAPLIKTVAGFTGKTFPDQIPGYFDDVFHAEVVGGDSNAVYRARTAGNENMTGKARHGGIFQVVEPDPNFQRFLQRIKTNKPHARFAEELTRRYGVKPGSK